MNSGYILNLEEWRRCTSNHDYLEYLKLGKKLKQKTPNITEDLLDMYILSDGHLSAECVVNDIFPETDATVFLSHSHKDMRDVTAFAGYLNYLGENPFVDSFVWGNAYELQDKINNLYSRGNDGGFVYEDVVETSANVYMILNGELIKMMDRVANYVLLESPESIEDSITSSPWLYSEILYSRILSHSQDIVESTKVDFPAYTSHLKSLSVNSIEGIFGRQPYL